MKIVKDFSEIKDMPAFLNSVVSNPALKEISDTKSSLLKVTSNLTSTNRDINSYESALLDMKRKYSMFQTEELRLNKKIEILEKASRNISTDTALTNINAKKFDEFLRPMGLRFFACQAIGEAVYFYFTREAKKVSYILTPPLMLRIRYGFNRDYDTYNLSEVRAMPLVYFNNINNYVHPHINSGSDTFKPLCLGNYFDILNNHKVSISFANWQDHCLLVDQLLSTYNSGSPYIHVSDLAKILKEHGYKINDREYTSNYINIDSASKFVMLADGLTQMHHYNPENILTKGMFDRFEKLIHELDVKSLVSDLIASLTTIYWDDEVEAHNKMTSFYSSVGIEIDDFDEVSDWSGYDEDSDACTLDEDSFESLKSKWLECLNKALASGKSMRVPKMSREEYAKYFGEDEPEAKEETTDEPKSESAESVITVAEGE